MYKCNLSLEVFFKNNYCIGYAVELGSNPSHPQKKSAHSVITDIISEKLFTCLVNVYVYVHISL